MALLDTRKGAGYLLFAVVVGHIVLISASVTSRKGVPILEAVIFGAFAEVQRVVSVGVSSVTSLWGGYVGLRQVNADNEQLKRSSPKRRSSCSGCGRSLIEAGASSVCWSCAINRS